MENSKKNLIVKRSGHDEYAIEYMTIHEFLSEQVIKEIPSYQRPYSWSKSNVEALLNDIDRSHKDNKEWFLGPIFTSYRLDKDKVREVLDGQQRLTTIVLILRVIYCAEYLVKEEVWSNPLFSQRFIEDSGKSKAQLREEFINNFSHSKDTIEEMLLIREHIPGSAPTYRSKFHTSLSTREKLNDFITQLKLIKNRADYEKYASFNFDHDEDFAPTLISLNRNLQIIEDRIRSFLYSSGKSKEDGLPKLNQFFTALLGLTFIQIPLNSAEDVVDIFESLNNRGKKLTLSDIIRFRTIKEFSGDNVKQEEIARKWNEIFKYSNKLSSNRGRYFSSLDVFIERFINSIAKSNAGYTDNSSRIDRFCAFYSTNGKNLENGVQDLLSVLRRWDYITNGDFARNKAWKNKQMTISSLVYLLRSCMLFSEASQIAFISYLRTQVSDDFKQEAAVLGMPFKLTQIVKTVFSISLYNKVQSNDARGLYIWIARSYDRNLLGREKLPTGEFKLPDGPYTYKYFSKEYINNEEESVPVVDVHKLSTLSEKIINLLWIKKTEKLTAQIILGLYQVLGGHEIPDESSFAWSQLDHIMPEKWFKNGGWLAVNSKDLLETTIDSIEEDGLQNAFKSLSKREDFYSETKWAPTFVQLIGNKVFLCADANREKSNSFWHFHKDNHSSSKDGVKKHLESFFREKPNESYIVPYGPQLVYDINDFTIANIVERSVDIVEAIVRELDDFEFSVQ